MKPLTYQTPAGALRGEPPQAGGIRVGVIRRRGTWHEITVIREEGDECLVSGATFFGWVHRDEVVESE